MLTAGILGKMETTGQDSKSLGLGGTMVERLPPLEGTIGHRKTLLGLYVAILFGCVVGLFESGPTPLNMTFVLLVPVCFVATFRGVRDSVILLLLATAGGFAVLATVAMDARGPGVVVWLLVAPVTVSLFANRRVLVATTGICFLTWLVLATTVPASTTSTWSQLRSHYVIILLGSSALAWFNSRRLDRWHGEAQEIVRAFDTVVDSHPMPAIVLLDGRIDMINAQACRLLRKERSQLLGERLESALPLNLGPDDSSGEFELQIDGKNHVIELRQSEVELPRGSGGIVVLIDRTDALEKEREEREQQLRRQDIERFDLVGRLAGGVAHDFNNLLATIMLNADLADFALQSDSEYQLSACHQEIRSAGEVAGRLVAQLLAYSGRGPVIREDVNVVAEVSSMIDLLRGHARTSNVKLSFSAESSLSIEADPTHIGQILMNLATNAIDACQDGGEVRVSVYRTELGSDDVEGMTTSPFFVPGPFLEIRVEDSGEGIPQESLGQIFEPYFTTRRQGSGLGLAAVRGIIDGQAGALSVVSTLGRGTVFRAFLPLAESARPAATSSPELPVELLIVDDEEQVLDVLSDVLRMVGFRVLQASTLSQARTMLDTHSEIGLVLSDFDLSDGCGLELKDHDGPTCRGRPLVLMSSYRVHECNGTDGLSFLSKPFELSEVVATLRKALEESEN